MSKRKSKHKKNGLKRLAALFFQVKKLSQAGIEKLTKIKQQAELNKGIIKTPQFLFGAFSFVLLASTLFGVGAVANLNYFSYRDGANPPIAQAADDQTGSLFFGQNEVVSSISSPSLKLAQDSFVYGVSVPRVLSPQTLGTLFDSVGGQEQYQDKEVQEYYVQSGDTIASIANKFGVSTETILWANNLSSSSVIKVGQKLAVLPVSGVVHVVKSGDTLSQISKTYKADIDDIVEFNELASKGDIFIGDILIVPGGTMPAKSYSAVAQSSVSSSFFIFPAEGKITQGLHWYNAVDVASKCGAPIHAAASGTVQRVSYGWNSGGGNLVTILHSNGIVTYYGHLQSILVSAGQKVGVGDRIALMGGQRGAVGSGISTGCHLHFGVTGAKNPLSKYYIGSYIKY